MHISYLSLGTNIGDREYNLRKAIEKLREKVRILSISNIYETEPVGFKEQDNFLNIVIKIATDMEVERLLDFVLNIEKEMGRKRIIHWGPRIIDIDILFFDDLIIDKENLKIPHPELHKRNFVLYPLSEVAYDFIHPVLNQSIDELKNSSFDKSKVLKYGRII